jgi:hypothetical protein
MRLHDTCIAIDGLSIRLRPSIGAALRLLERHKSMQSLMDGVLAGNLSVIGDLIAETACESNASAAFEKHVESWPLARFLDELAQPLLMHIAFLCGVDKDAKPQLTEEGAPLIDWVKHYRELYGIATGFLQWTPEAAWDASALDICAAYQKRLEIIRAMQGIKTEPRELTPHTERDPDARKKLLKGTKRGKRNAA